MGLLKTPTPGCLAEARLGAAALHQENVRELHFGVMNDVAMDFMVYLYFVKGKLYLVIIRWIKSTVTSFAFVKALH